MKFKVGDKVKFIKQANSVNNDPPLNSVHTIVLIDELGYWYAIGGDQSYFFEEEILPANSQIIREKLGIK